MYVFINVRARLQRWKYWMAFRLFCCFWKNERPNNSGEN